MVITARTGFLVWLVAIVVAAAVPLTCVFWSTRPYRPEECRDSFEIRSQSESTFTCSVGAHIETRQVAPSSAFSAAMYEVRCVCPRDAVDAAAAGS